MKTYTTAAAEAAKNIEIYNALADIAREVFNHLNGAEEGKIYTPADIARAIVGGPVVTCVNGLNYRCDRVEKYEIGGFSWSEGYDPETAYTVENGGFSCRVIAWKIFDVVDRAARSLDIPAAARVTFERPRAAAPVVVSFTLSAAAARELAACCAKDQLRPVLNGVHVDTRRRVLVASDGHVLRVVPMGAALTVDESAAAPSYIVPADVIKSGRVVTIDANDIAATDKKSAPCIAGRFPNWAAVVPAVSDAGRVALTADQWKQLKKAVATAATVHPSGKYSYRHVVIAHEFMSDKLHVYAENYDFCLERDIVVPVDNCRDQFSIRFDADDFKRIGGNVTALYLRDQSRAIVTTDAAGLSLVMPKLQNTDDKYNMYFSFAEGVTELLQGVDIAAAAAEIKEEHIKAAAADIVADVREKCEGKSAAKMLKYMNDNYGWSDALNMARDILAAEIAAETAATANETPAPAADVFEAVSVETTAAPAADQTTPAEAVSDRENDRNDNESDTPAETITDDTNETTDAPALTLPPLAVLLTTTDDRAPLSLTLPTPAPVLLLPLLTSDTATASETITNETTTDGDTAAPWSSPFATLPELPTTDNTADTADASELLTIATTDATPAADPDESDRPAVTVAANFARRARRWFHVAAAVLAVLIITAAPVAITDNESDTPAAVLTITPDTLTANETPAADVLAVSEAVSVETTAAPAADRPAVRKRHHAPQNERHHRRAIVPDTLTAEAPADTLAAPLLTITPDTLTADTLTAPALAADTLESVRNITENADTLEHARDITAAPAADIDTDNETPAEAVTASENDDDAPAEVISTDTDNEIAADAPATSGTTATASTPTPAPVASLSPAVLAFIIASF